MNSSKILGSVIVALSAALIGCDGFGPPPALSTGTDAGVTYVGDAVSDPRTGSDSGTTPRVDAGSPRVEVDSGSSVTVPVTGGPCDPDIDVPVRCSHATCSEAFMVCDMGVWSGCLPALAECYARPDAGSDAGTDAGPPDCASRPVIACESPCGHSGVRVCAAGVYGACLYDPSRETCGVDAGASLDAGVPVDAYVAPDAYMAPDAYVPPGSDAGTDAGSDAGPAASTHTVDFLFTVSDAMLQSTSSMVFFQEMATNPSTHARAVAPDPACESGSGLVVRSGVTYLLCRLTRPVGTDFYYTGSFTRRDGSASGVPFYATFSAWNNPARTCGDAAATTGVAWRVEEVRGVTVPAGTNYLSASALPEIVQAPGVTEDGLPVCRGRFRF